jgi:hypothetical protein
MFWISENRAIIAPPLSYPDPLTEGINLLSLMVFMTRDSMNEWDAENVVTWDGDGG